MYKLIVFLPQATLTYYIQKYIREDGRIKFTDPKTGQPKDYPDSMVAIEVAP